MKTARTAFGLGAAVALFAAGWPGAQAAGPGDLAARIDALLDKPGLKRVLFSACVVRADTGETVYERNPRLPLVPASNMKVVTTAGALETLGPDFAFVTRVGLSGDALAVIGDGDPLFGYRGPGTRSASGGPSIPDDIAARLKAAGVAALSDILLDVSVFDGERVHPAWPEEQLSHQYACEVSGLNYLGNCADIVIEEQDGRVELLLEPPSGLVRLINAVTPRSQGRSRISLDRTSVAGELRVAGTCRGRAGPYAFAVEDPPLFFGGLLRESLAREGIEVTGSVRLGALVPGAEFRPVAIYRTPLVPCLAMANKESLGLAAEALFKRIGARRSPDGRGGSWAGGRAAVSDYLRGLGLDDADFVLSDGSGLSRDNRLNAWALTRILLDLRRRPDWALFEGTLAVGGEDGTIEDQFREKPYRGRVRAKSGYLRAVRALSGVVRADDGDYVFSFLANKAGSGARQAIDAAVKSVVDWGAAVAGSSAPPSAIR